MSYEDLFNKLPEKMQSRMKTALEKQEQMFDDIAEKYKDRPEAEEPSLEEYCDTVLAVHYPTIIAVGMIAEQLAEKRGLDYKKEGSKIRKEIWETFKEKN